MVFDPMQLFLGGACVLTLVAYLCPVCLTVLASAVLSYIVGAGVGLSLAVGPGIVVRALVSDHTLGWPNNAGPIWCVGIPLGLAVFVTLMALLFRDPGEGKASRAHA
ncbi:MULTISPECIES: hypothetical protein [Burkholderia]|uniref:hypothetical protein n=1 Tax=Burkholderia TaxID=32008 RepID=UPI00163ED13A|nr:MULTISPECIES: hypothetical protein [Burkholderia]MBJ9920614.1 hypothetical protein [Burkholderia cenocepacia]UVS90876.1 hypothetical protein EFP17_14515 [Burkholderia glumae]